MNNERKTELKVGATVTLGLLLLVFILGWAKNYDLSASRLNLQVKFPNVAGLEVGDNVTVNGVRKGYVDQIKVYKDHAVVHLTFDSDVKLYSDAKFYLSMLDLMGGKKIEVKPGTTNTPVNPADIISGEFQADIPSVMAFAGSLESEIPVILKEVNKSLTGLNNYLSDQSIKEGINESLANLTSLTRELNAMIVSQKYNIEKLIDNSVKLSENANTLITDNRDSLKVLIANLNDFIRSAQELEGKITALFDETKNKDNNLGKALYDEEFLKEIKETLKQTKYLIDTLNGQLNGNGIKVDAKLNLF